MRIAIAAVSLFSLACFADAPAKALVVHASGAPTHRIAEGKGTATLFLNATNGSPEVALTKLVLEAGAKVGEHTHDSGEWLYVLSGAGEFTVSGEKLSAKEGDAIFIPKGAKHSAGVAAGAKAPLVAVQVYAPAGAEQRFTKGPKVDTAPAPAR